MQDETKIVELGTKGKNSATITTTKIAHPDLTQKSGFQKLKHAGTLLAPHGCHYLGSAAIHYYEEDTGDPANPVFKTVVQSVLDNVHEGLADFGHKRLQEAMMDSYGRKQPRIRQK